MPRYGIPQHKLSLLYYIATFVLTFIIVYFVNSRGLASSIAIGLAGVVGVYIGNLIREHYKKQK